VTLIERRADDRVAARTDPALTRVRLRTGIPVVACGAVRLRWIRADTSAGVTGPGVVTLIQRAAGDRITTRTDAALTGVELSTGIAVIADCAVRSAGRGTHAA